MLKPCFKYQIILQKVTGAGVGFVSHVFISSLFGLVLLIRLEFICYKLDLVLYG